MKKSKWFSIFLVGLFGLFFMCPTSNAANTIKVGIVDTYTGPPSAYTLDVLDGFKMAVEKICSGGWPDACGERQCGRPASLVERGVHGHGYKQGPPAVLRHRSHS